MQKHFRKSAALIVNIVKQFYQNNGFVLAGALSFFTLLSIIPLTILITSLMGWFLPEQFVQVMFESYRNFVPLQMQSGVDTSLLAVKKLKLGFSLSRLFQSLFSTFFLIWLGSLIFDIIERILSVTFKVQRLRHFWKSKLTHILLMLFLGSLYIILTVLSAVADIVTDYLALHFPATYDLLIQSLGLNTIVSILMNLFFSSTLFFIIYKTSTTQKLKTRCYIQGAVFAATLWVAAKYVFGLYLENINDFTLFFGALAVITRIALWIFYSSIIFILGAEVAVFSSQEKPTS